MKKVLLVIVVIFGFGVLAIAGLVMIRVLGTRKGPAISTTQPTAAPNNSVSYADLFSDGEGGGDGTAEAEAADDSATEDMATDTSMEDSSMTDTSMADSSVDPTQDEDLLLGTAPEPTPRKRRAWAGGGSTTRNTKPVGHKKFGKRNSRTSSASSDTSFTTTSSGADDFDDFETTTAAATDTGGGDDLGDSFADDVFGDTSGGGDIGGDDFGAGGDDGFGDTFGDDTATETAAVDPGGGDTGGGGDDSFAEFFDDGSSGGAAGGGDSGGGADAFAATGGGGASQSFKVAATGPAVRKVSHSRSGGLTEVRVELSNVSRLPQYRVFPLRAGRGKPARIMIDFEETAVGAGPPVAGDGALISKIKVLKKKGASAPIGRVMVELTPDNTKPPPVDWREEGGALIVVIGGSSRLGQGREFPRRD